ncbi:MAG: OmpH family outer membrane protein, partial [bacterium]
MTFLRRPLALAAAVLGLGVTVLAAEPATAGTPAVVPGKLGYVNMEKVFQGYYKTMRSDAAFKKQRDIYEQHFNDARIEMERLKRQRDDCRERSLNIALADDVRNQNRKDAEEKDTLLRDKDRELRDFFQKKDVELKRKFMELRGELVKELSDFLKTYAIANRYEVVLDTSGMTQNMIPAVVYYDPVWPAANALTTRAREVLKYRGLSDDQILWLGHGSEADALPTRAALATALGGGTAVTTDTE